MIEVIVNGERKQIGQSLNLRDLLLTLNLPTERVAIELNKDVIRKKDWVETTMSNRDQIEVIHFVGGG